MTFLEPITSKSFGLGVHEARRLGFDPVDVRKTYAHLVEGLRCDRDLRELPLLDFPHINRKTTLLVSFLKALVATSWI